MEPDSLKKYVAPSATELKVEFDLLRYCATSSRSGSHSKWVRETVASGVDWTFFFYLAHRHRVVPLVLKSLEEIFGDELPVEIADPLRAHAYSTKLKNAFLLNELSRTLDLLDSNAIRALTLKGAALAHIAYGSVSLRPFVDLDILISPADFLKTKAVLLDAGYEPFSRLLTMSKFRERLYLWQTRQYQFQRARGVFNLDLHVEIMPPLFDFRIEFDELYERSELQDVENTRLRTFAAEDMLFILSFHCVKNRWEQLKHVCDVAEFTRSQQSKLNWDHVFRHAKELRCRNILFLSLSLAARVLSAPVPPEILQSLSSSSMNRIVDEAVQKILTNSGASITLFSRRIHENMSIQDTFVQRLKYLGGAMVRRIADITSPSTHAAFRP